MVLIQSAEHKSWKTRLGGCFWKVLTHFNWFKYFRSLMTPCRIVTKKFILDATDILDPPLSRLQYYRLEISPSQCSHQALDPLCLAMQSSTKTLEQRSVESWFWRQCADFAQECPLFSLGTRLSSYPMLFSFLDRVNRVVSELFLLYLLQITTTILYK